MIESDPAKAEQELLAASEKEPLKGEAALLLAKLYTKQNKTDEAITYGKQAAALLPESSEAHFVYAAAISRKMSSNPGFAMANLGNYREALDKALELDPNNYDAHVQRIGFLASAPPVAGGSLEKAKAAAAELEAKSEKDGLIAYTIIYDKENDAAKLEETYTRLQAIEPSNRNHFQIAMSQVQQGKDAEAIPHFRHLVDAKDPDYRWAAQYQLARALIVSDSDVAQGIEMLKTYIAEAPDKGRNLPTKAGAYWRLGDAEEKLGNVEAAKAAYEQALKLNPEEADAKTGLERLNAN